MTDTRAMPILLCSDVDDIRLSNLCAQALLYTLVCIQPHREKFEKKWKPTWEYVKNRNIEICLVPIKGSRPIFVDLTQIVEDNLSELARTICDYAESETMTDVQQALALADYYKDDYDKARELVEDARDKHKCPDYIYTACLLYTSPSPRD